MGGVRQYITKLENALEAANKRNKDLEAKVREMTHKKNMYKDELEFAKSLLKQKMKFGEKNA